MDSHFDDGRPDGTRVVHEVTEMAADFVDLMLALPPGGGWPRRQRGAAP